MKKKETTVDTIINLIAEFAMGALACLIFFVVGYVTFLAAINPNAVAQAGLRIFLVIAFIGILILIGKAVKYVIGKLL